MKFFWEKALFIILILHVMIIKLDNMTWAIMSDIKNIYYFVSNANLTFADSENIIIFRKLCIQAHRKPSAKIYQIDPLAED